MADFWHDLLEHLHLTDDEDLDDDAYYLREYPDLATLSDEEIEGIAMKYLSRVDYEESDYHRVREHMLRLRNQARAAGKS